MKIELKTCKHGIWLLPTMGIGSQKYYYGYPVIVINFVWLKWQVFFVFGVKKIEDVIEK